MAKTVYIGVAFDTKQLVTGADIAAQTIKRFESVVSDASGNVQKSSVPALDAYTRATINAEKAMRQTTSAVVPLKIAKAELTKQTQELQAAMRAQVTTEAGMQAQAKTIAAATRDQAAAQKLYDQSLRDSGKSINEHSFSLGNLAKGALAAGAAYISFQAVLGVGRSLIDISDKYTMLEGRIKLVTSGSAELALVQASLFDISQRTRVSTQDTSNLYIQLAQSTQGLGISQKQLLGFTESLNKALVVSGASAEEGANAMRQFGQSLAGGVMRGEEYNSVMESTPRVMKMIEDGLGMTRGEMRKFMLDGKLTTEMLVEGLAKGAAKVDEEFAGMGTTVGQAMTEVKNAYESVINDANKASEGTTSLAGSIEGLARTIEQNKGGIISAFEGIANSVGWAVDRLASFGNAYKLNQLYQTGKISLWDYATAGPDKAKQFIAKQGAPGASIGDETGMQMAIAARAAAPAIKEVTKATRPHTAAAQNHTKAASSGASAASRAAASAADAAIKTQAWSEALRESENALSGVSRKTMTLAQAEENVQRAFQASLASQKMSIAHTREITAATREYLAAKSDQKRLEQEVKDALVRGNEALALGTEKTVSVSDATKEHDEALAALNASILINSDASLANGETKADLERKSRAATDAFRVETEAVQAQGTARRVAVEDVGKAYTALTGTTLVGADAMGQALQRFNGDLRSTADLASAAGEMIGGSFGKTISVISEVAKSISSVAQSLGLLNEQSAEMLGTGVGGAVGVYQASRSGGVGGALAGAASGAAIGSVIPGVGTLIGGAVGGLIGLFSDPRLKEDIVPTGLTASGFALYDYSYKADRDHQRYRGVMSPEVRRRRPDAVGVMGGYDFVNYQKLGIPIKQVSRYAAGGVHSGGLAVVGDGGGPELVDLPAGARVYSNSESKGMLDNSAVVTSLGEVTELLHALLNLCGDQKVVAGKMYDILDRVTQGGTRVRMVAA